MNNQTIKNGPADRSDEAKIELEKRLRSIWLGIECLVKTFNGGDKPKVDTSEINDLLDEPEKVG